MMGIGVMELIILGVCSLSMLLGLVVVVALAFSSRNRARGNLINCPDCGRGVSPQAPACPNCGRPMS
jgi:hypothetical protein